MPRPIYNPRYTFDTTTGAWARIPGVLSDYDKQLPENSPITGKPRRDRRRRTKHKATQWTYKQVTGKWRSKLLQKCRETGYVHTTGPWAGNINYYRLTIETGLSRALFYNVMKRGFMSLDTLGKLCDVFHCQPNDFIERISREEAATAISDLPESLTEGDLPGDEYVQP